jgi:photosystem II stability/assembly factor-like uncharacterized protein
VFLAGFVAAITLSSCAALGLGLGDTAPSGPTTTQIVAASFVDASNGWIAASECPNDAETAASSACRTLIYHTTDGGQSWTRASRFLLSPRSMQFVDKNTGWLVGSVGERCGSQLCPNAVMLSTDAGKTWNRVSMESAELTGGAAASANDTWVVGQSCRSSNQCAAIIARTTTAGQLWDNADLALQGSDIFADRVDPQHGWIASASGDPQRQSSILATSDGGAHWTVQAAPCLGGTRGLDFTSPTVGWLYCSATPSNGAEPGILYRSTDGGNSWSKISPVAVMTGASGPAGVLPPTPAAATTSASATGPETVAFTSPTSGWVATRDGVLLATADGGNTWRAALSAGEPIRAVQFVDATRGWTIGVSSVWQTRDGGITWGKSTPLK